MNIPVVPTQWVERWMPPRGYRLFLSIILILIMMLGVDALILKTGGIKFSTIHLMYIPIILASVLFSWPGGLIAGIIAGVLAGPYIPVNLLTNEMQTTTNWMIRTGFFALIGTFSGAMSQVLLSTIKNIRWVANHHLKSELPNRLHLETKLNTKLQRHDPPFYLVLIAIINYDHICDLFGYTAVDELILSLKKHITARFPEIYYYSHYHPERLAIIVDVSQIKNPGNDTNPLIDLLGESLPLNNLQIHLHTAIGYVASDFKADETAESMIQKAEIALYHARSKRLEIALYSDDIETVSKESLVYLGALRDALANNELMLYYQPKQSLQTGKIAGAEALIRWNSPTLGFIQPDKFIPQAEETQLIQPLTRFVIESAFAELATLTAQGKPIKISLNLATKNLSDSGLLTFIKDCLAKHQLDVKFIDFEITESAVMANPDVSIHFMKQLKSMGFSLSIDDYGTGYASLSYLKKLPIDTLKIDQSFIRDILTQHTSQEIVAATINMAKALNLTTIAEGVETDEISDLLKHLGCDIIQGYLYSKPITFSALQTFMQDTY